MLNTTPKPASDSSTTTISTQPPLPPVEDAKSTIAQLVAFGSPRVVNRPPASTPNQQRERTGLGKALEMSLINASIRNSPVRLDFSAVQGDVQDTGPATPSEAGTVNSPRRDKKLSREYPSLKNRVVSSPKDKSGASRPALSEIRMVKPTKTLKEETARSPRHAPNSPRIGLADAKNKLEELVSPKSRIRHLFEEVEWLTLTNSHRESRDGGFGQNRITPDSPTCSPLSGGKRKAEDEPGCREQKRARFKDDDVSKGRESSDEDARNVPGGKQSPELEKLSTELRELAPETPAKTKTSAIAEINTNTDDNGSYPFKSVGLGKAILKARQKNQRWFSPVAHETGSEALKVTLNGLRDANPGKIDIETACFLQELFSLLPAGAIAGTEIFRKGLSRAIRELSLTNEQWKRIETLNQNFDSLDISKNPRGYTEFKKMLNYIISKKNAMANRAPKNLES